MDVDHTSICLFFFIVFMPVLFEIEAGYLLLRDIFLLNIIVGNIFEFVDAQNIFFLPFVYINKSSQKTQRVKFSN